MLFLAPLLHRAVMLRLLAVGNVLTLVDGLLVGGIPLLKGRILNDPLGLIGACQFRKRLLITDELRLQAANERVQMVGVGFTLLPDLLLHSLRLALGFCGFSRLATVICVFHVAGFGFRLLHLEVAKVDFRVVVLDFLGFGRFLDRLGFLALFGSFRLLGLFLFLLLDLVGPAHHEGQCGFVASLAAILGEIRRIGCLVNHEFPQL